MKYMWSIPFLSSALKKRFLPAVYHCKLQWVVHSLIMSFSIPRHVIPNKTFICQHLSRYYNYHRIYIQFCMPNIDLHDILLGFFKLSIQSSDNEDNETDFNRNPNIRKWVLIFFKLCLNLTCRAVGNPLSESKCKTGQLIELSSVSRIVHAHFHELLNCIPIQKVPSSPTECVHQFPVLLAQKSITWYWPFICNLQVF